MCFLRAPSYTHSLIATFLSTKPHLEPIINLNINQDVNHDQNISSRTNQLFHHAREFSPSAIWPKDPLEMICGKQIERLHWKRAKNGRSPLGMLWSVGKWHAYGKSLFAKNVSELLQWGEYAVLIQQPIYSNCWLDKAILRLLLING